MNKLATRYLLTLMATMLVGLGLAFAFNVSVDPLWYFQGNQWGSVNYAFNERVTKVNRFLPRQSEYDCIIFGDSRITLLPEEKITGHHCYNFAFSAGKGEEFLAYAKYLDARGFRPDLVIVGLSISEYRAHVGGPNIPGFISEQTDPLSYMSQYLSLDTLAYAYRTLFGKSPIDRVYDSNFHCHVASGATHYDPAVPIRDLKSGPFTGLERIDLMDQMRLIFPNARFVGYTPPISAWAIQAYDEMGWLDDYTHALHRASSVFDAYYDFSVPSDITTNPVNTYDGTHYSEEANALIASAISTGDTGQALDLKDLSEEEMRAAYHARLTAYQALMLRPLKGD
ncbi:MAG: hypothetical protein GC184_12520 [Rhizobiales bacterium]|nr:hypothetical protein [Hyphomicrobiales bacterium]